jgi:hypothetical protein
MSAAGAPRRAFFASLLALALLGPRLAAAAFLEGAASAEAGGALRVAPQISAPNAPQALLLTPSWTGGPALVLSAPSLSAAAAIVQVPALAAAVAAPSAVAAPAEVPPLAAAPALAPSIAAADGAPRPPSAFAAAREAAAKPTDPAQVPGAVFDGAPAAGEGELLPFRARIREAGLYLLHRDAATRDDSLGRRLSPSLASEDVRSALKARGADALRGEILYATGVEMGSEKAAAERLRGLLAELGLGADVRVRILSVPRAWSAGFGRALRDRIVYFLPSRTRDFQAPLRDEVIAGSLTTLILETPNAAYLLSTLPHRDALVVLGVHTAVLAVYTVFQRTMGNWITRSTGAESFAKNGLAALPFILNYNVFGHLTAIQEFGATAGAGAVLRALPGQGLQFLVTQGLTVALQTEFYARVVMQGFRGWAGSQKLPGDAVAARSWVNVILLPWLWVDSIFLTQASTASTVVLRIGPFLLTGGHLALAGLLAAGTLFVSRPQLLDRSLAWYRRVRSAASRLIRRS